MIVLCDWLLRERFLDCAQLGRDLILVIMRMSKVPQFAVIWRQLFFEPTKLAPNFGGKLLFYCLVKLICYFNNNFLLGFCCYLWSLLLGVEELMSRSFANFQTYRVSVAIQRKMEFILKLKAPAHEKHLEWFRKQVIFKCSILVVFSKSLWGFWFLSERLK